MNGNARCPFAPAPARPTVSPLKQIGLERVADLLATELPILNGLALSSQISVADLIEAVRPVAASLCELADGTYDNATAEKALALLGFVVSSAERHAQDAGMPAGIALAALGAEDALARFGFAVGCAPTLTAYGFWIENKLHISFTGDVQERLFQDCVVAIDALNNEAADAIEAIAHLDICDFQEMAERIAAATTQMDRVRDVYGDFLATGDDGKPKFSGTFFTRVFRQYLVGIPVRGQYVTGPNATDCIGGWRLDALLGYCSEWYRHEIEHKHLQYVPRRIHGKFLRSWHAPSVPAVLASRLMGIDLSQFMAARDAESVTVIRAMSPGGLMPLRGLAALHAGMVRVTGRHRGLVKKFLENTAKAMTDSDRGDLVVSALAGTGGSELGDFLDPVFEMRCENPVMKKIARVLTLLDASNTA